MLSRLVWNVLTVASVATLVGVGWFFVRAFQSLDARGQNVADLEAWAEREGSCSALLEATRRRRIDAGFDARRGLDALRDELAGQILAAPQDRKGQRALVAAADEGLLDLALCQQIAITTQGGEAHPVMALLRFSRERDPCEEALSLDTVIAGLGFHRALLLRGLLEDVSRLRCLTPPMRREVALQSTNMLREDPQAFDDLDVWRIAGFLAQWAPLRAAQIGCRIEARGDVSRLGNALGCSEDQRERVLTHYRYRRALPGEDGEPGSQPEGQGEEVLLLWRDGPRCEVRPVEGPPRLVTVVCDDLEMVSVLDVAVRIEEVDYGVVRADMISGLLRYDGAAGQTVASRMQPHLGSWFAYDRTGNPMGTTAVTDLTQAAEIAGVELPQHPLRTFCRAAGARYCYDVDWTQLVERVEGAAVVFLSRPLDVMLPEAVLSAETRQRLFAAAVGAPPAADTVARFYHLGGERYLLAEVRPGGLQLRWPRGDGVQGWASQGFGTALGGDVPPMARLLAVMDLQGDGAAELILQQTSRVRRGRELQDASDEILLLHLNPQGERFVPLTQLTVREY